MAAGNYDRVVSDAIAQVQAGAHMLDVNAGIPLADEPAIMATAVQLVQSVTDVPLSIDSSVVAALERGLRSTRARRCSILSPVKRSGWSPSCPRQEVRRRRHRHLQRRDRHLRGPRRTFCGG